MSFSILHDNGAPHLQVFSSESQFRFTALPRNHANAFDLTSEGFFLFAGRSPLPRPINVLSCSISSNGSFTWSGPFIGCKEVFIVFGQNRDPGTNELVCMRIILRVSRQNIGFPVQKYQTPGDCKLSDRVRISGDSRQSRSSS
jgi:hypothetical protein